MFPMTSTMKSIDKKMTNKIRLLKVAVFGDNNKYMNILSNFTQKEMAC